MENINENSGAELTGREHVGILDNMHTAEGLCFCDSLFLGDIIELEIRFGEGPDAYSYGIPDSMLWP